MYTTLKIVGIWVVVAVYYGSNKMNISNLKYARCNPGTKLSTFLYQQIFLHISYVYNLWSNGHYVIVNNIRRATKISIFFLIYELYSESYSAGRHGRHVWSRKTSRHYIRSPKTYLLDRTVRTILTAQLDRTGLCQSSSAIFRTYRCTNHVHFSLQFHFMKNIKLFPRLDRSCCPLSS